MILYILVATWETFFYSSKSWYCKKLLSSNGKKMPLPMWKWFQMAYLVICQWMIIRKIDKITGISSLPWVIYGKLHSRAGNTSDFVYFCLNPPETCHSRFPFPDNQYIQYIFPMAMAIFYQINFSRAEKKTTNISLLWELEQKCTQYNVC